jgi:hypothetical protein
MRLAWHGGDSNSAVVNSSHPGNANYANNRTPKAFDQNSFARHFVKWNTLHSFIINRRSWREYVVLYKPYRSPCNERRLKFTDYLITTRNRHDNNKPASPWKSMRLLQTVAFCLILTGLLRLTVAIQSACRICEFLQRSVSIWPLQKFPNTALWLVCYG